MSIRYLTLPAYGSPSWKSPVATAADLPAIGNSSGDVRVVIDIESLYIWNGSAWILEVAPGATPPGGSNTQVQFNNAGAFAGSPSLTYVSGTGTLTATAFVGNLTGTATNVTGVVSLASGGFGLPNTQQAVATSGNITALVPTSTFVNFTAAVAKTLQGMVNPGGNSRIVIRNTGSAPLTISNQSSGASAADRFALEASVDLVIVSGAETEFLYNTASSRWNVKEIRNQVANDAANNLYSLISGNVASLGTSNITLGFQALGSHTSFAGGANIIIGYQAGQNVIGNINDNVIIGHEAGKALTHTGAGDGNSNVMVGSGAGKAMTLGTGNTILGANAGASTTTGVSNVLFGQNGGTDNTTGNYGVALGLGSGVNHQTGDYNISIGQSSGAVSAHNLTYTVAIGAQARVTSSGQVNIGGTNNTFIGIKNVDPQYDLDVSGNVNISGSYLINGVSQNAWTLSGNSGTDSNTNFLGTTDFQDFVIKTNDVPAVKIDVNGLSGFQEPTPNAIIHAGTLGATVTRTVSITATPQITISGYAFGTGGENYEYYSTRNISGTMIFSTPPATTTFVEPPITDYDVTGASAISNDGSGYDPNTDPTPSYEIWALWASGAIQSLNQATAAIGSWPNTNPQEVTVSWTAPAATAENPVSYFIARNATDSQTVAFGTNTLLDQNSGWSGGATPGQPPVANYTVNLSGPAVTGIIVYRYLNTTNGTFFDAGTTTADVGDWASGSTVTPTNAQYLSLKTEGASLLSGQLSLGSIFVLGPTQTPLTSGASGTAGQFAWDASYLYICIATDTWQRVATSTW